MGLVERVFCKIHHFRVNFQTDLFRNAPGHTAGHALLGIAVNEIRPFFFHDRLLFLAHRTANQVASSHRVAAEVAHNLHNLLLIHDTAVGRRQDRFQLRTGIGDFVMIVFSFNIFWNKVHRPGTVQGNTRDDILQVLGL